MFLSRFILASASVAYALRVPVDSNPCKHLLLIYPSLFTYLFLASDPNVPYTLMVAQLHAGGSAPTSRMGAQQNICSQYGTPYDTTQYSCLAPTCINTGNGNCGPYCGGTLTPCSGACPPKSVTSCGLAARGCTIDVGKCIDLAMDIIAKKFPEAIVYSIRQISSDGKTCLTDVENDKPLLNCLGKCAQPSNSVLQTVACAVSCAIENGPPSSCETFLGESVLLGIAASSEEAGLVIMVVEAVQCLLSHCST